MKLPPALPAILRGLQEAEHRAWIVGGAVRDHLLGQTPKDIDVEVYGITYDQLAARLGRTGRVDLVGRSFGVVKYTHPSGGTWDFSIPRRENKVGRGHRDFQATFDPDITPREAAARRDFTINAMAWDALSGELHDYFGGQDDLAARRLRAVGPAFAEDPLRVLRGMQFACRFNLTVDKATASVCRSIAGEYTTLARERVAEEWMKWAVKAPWPGLVLGYLEAAGWLEHFPALARLRGVPQDAEWHPEGDVAVHSMEVVDRAAAIAEREELTGDARATLLFAALAHDFGKPATTVLREKRGRMRWTAHGHDKAGVEPAREFLTSIGIKADIKDRVEPLVLCHLAHFNPGPVRRLAVRVAPASIAELLWLMEADKGGISLAAEQLREAARELKVQAGPPPPIVQGRHVLPYFEDRPGPHIGKVVKSAYEAQLEGLFMDEAGAKAWLESHLRERIGPVQPPT
jgi:tRNA nucleotidyltransferase (CCA-adding enzyme)